MKKNEKKALDGDGESTWKYTFQELLTFDANGELIYFQQMALSIARGHKFQRRVQMYLNLFLFRKKK